MEENREHRESAKLSESKETPTAAEGTVEEEVDEEIVSPPAGRALGGGTGRSPAPGGGAGRG
jgi:hypothetical protein